MEQTMTTYQTICKFCNTKHRTGEKFTNKAVYMHLQSCGIQASYAYVCNIIKALRLSGHITRLDVGTYICTISIPHNLSLTLLNKIAYPIFKYSKDTYEVSICISMLQQNVYVDIHPLFKKLITQLDVLQNINKLFISFKVDTTKLTYPKQCYVDILSNDKLAYDKCVRSIKFKFD